MYKGEIPFRNGSVLHHETDGRWRESSGELYWVNNFAFSGKLTLLDKINSGHSAKYLTVSVNDKEHPMFVKDFLSAVITFGADKGGEINGNWCFCKRGQNYGICPYTENK